MKKIISIITVAVLIPFCAVRSNAGQSSAATWLNFEISAPVDSTQSVETFIKLRTESFLNDNCQPTDVDGIQALAVQVGHNEVFHLHIYCRQDRNASTRFSVTLLPVPNHEVDQTAKTALGKSNVRLGPLYLGARGEPDAILLIEKTR